MLEEQWEGGIFPFSTSFFSFDPLSLSAQSLVMHSCRVLGEDREPQRSGRSYLHTLCTFPDTHHCPHTYLELVQRSPPRVSDISQDRSLVNSKAIFK